MIRQRPKPLGAAHWRARVQAVASATSVEIAREAYWRIDNAAPVVVQGAICDEALIVVVEVVEALPNATRFGRSRLLELLEQIVCLGEPISWARNGLKRDCIKAAAPALDWISAFLETDPKGSEDVFVAVEIIDAIAHELPETRELGIEALGHVMQRYSVEYARAQEYIAELSALSAL